MGRVTKEAEPSSSSTIEKRFGDLGNVITRRLSPWVVNRSVDLFLGPLVFPSKTKNPRRLMWIFTLSIWPSTL